MMFLSVATNITLASLARGDARRRSSTTGGNAALARELDRAAAHPHPGRRPPLCRNLQRRQSAKGRAGALDDGAVAHPDPGPPDARARRRRQGGGLRPDPRRSRRTASRSCCLRHAGGDDRAVPPHPGHARRRRHRHGSTRRRAASPNRSICCGTWSDMRTNAGCCTFRHDVGRGPAARLRAAAAAARAGGGDRRLCAEFRDVRDARGHAVRHVGAVRAGGGR